MSDSGANSVKNVVSVALQILADNTDNRIAIAQAGAAFVTNFLN